MSDQIIISRHRTRAMARLMEARLERAQLAVQRTGYAVHDHPMTRAERLLVGAGIPFTGEVMVLEDRDADGRWVVVHQSA